MGSKRNGRAPGDGIRVKRIGTGIFTKTTSRASDPEAIGELLKETARRQGEDPLAAIGRLEQHAVEIARRRGSTVVPAHGGYSVVSGLSAAVAAVVANSPGALGPLKGAGTRPRNPEYEDALHILAEVRLVRHAIDAGDTATLIKACLQLGAAATRLRVRPFEDGAIVGTNFVESQRSKARKRHGDVSARKRARVAAFKNARGTSTSDHAAMVLAAKRLKCGVSAVRTAVMEDRGL